ncbi:MAG: hydroxymethylpyrimidine/phosphomethylpyrimidine kinase [Deltaproteobacteria bacterium]|jgi:hydroxymethylpyrimidine/phosphomethylpyrimidine kinase|nr:hydroxymethylpyrimidine/phosphomethylpyrimidine kinase [Deltaproteobacteria bacterium]MCL5880107.1 hydroxymethylpyrimidine/phosphomethylpyrimidine kinase [Deltaproteobacteria bacterium]MDA8304842.1 hydroxymethylpyrimidine/phosphomethylpyrimidine kinase [Deltaproteobacteria bacterium]
MIKALSVAGFDGSGGAGITSDTKIFSRFKIFGLSAITAMTAQNPDNIYGIIPASGDFFDKELKAVFDYFKVDAVKTGLIAREEQSLILSEYIKKYMVKIVVIDPVYISTSNKRLAMKHSNYPDFLMPLFKLATVITPNIMEAELISGEKIDNLNGMKKAAKRIKESMPGIKNIIIKGSHIKPDLNDNKIYNVLLDSENKFFVSISERIKLDKEIHGTGCAFSAALTAYLAKGLKIEEALIKTGMLVSKFIKDFRKIPDNSRDKHIYITGNI